MHPLSNSLTALLTWLAAISLSIAPVCAAAPALTPLFVGITRENEKVSYSLNTKPLKFESLITECNGIAKDFGTADPVLLIFDYRCTFQDLLTLSKAIREIGFTRVILLLGNHNHENYRPETEIMLHENWKFDSGKPE